MTPLTAPMKGVYFNLFGLLIHLNFAKTLLWAFDRDLKRRMVRETHLISLAFIKEIDSTGKAINVVVGPFKIVFGWN